MMETEKYKLGFILVVFVVYGEWVNLEIVLGTCFYEHPYCNRQRYIVVSPSSDKRTHCKSLWIKVSAKCKRKHETKRKSLCAL